MKITLTKPDDEIHNLNDEVKRSGDKFTRKITRALKKESWRWTALELAWTAGLTVIVGLYLAYYIGYGKSPESSVIFYFGTYTAVSVLMAIFVRIIRTQAHEEESLQNQRLLLRCNNHIFSLMRKARNEGLANMDKSQQRIYVAGIILRNPESTSDQLAMAVLDLTANPALAEGIRHIETFRHHGMQTCVQDEYNKMANHITKHYNQLLEISPFVANLFKRRMQGEAPTMQEGLSRPAGFLERTLNAVEHNDISLMTFDDVYDIFSLAFEMLNGREIPVLHPEFKGHEDFVMTQEKLDRSRSYLRRAIAKRNSRLKALVDLLTSTTNSEIITPTSFNSEDLVELVNEQYKHLRKEINNLLKDDYKPQLRKLYRVLKQSFQLSSKIERYQKRAARYLRAFQNIQKDYNKMWRKHGQSITLTLGDEKQEESGVYIREEFITLDDEEKMFLANKFIVLHQHILADQPEKITRFANIELSPQAFKRLAMEYVLIMDEVLHFSQPEEMFAIEYSNSPCFDHIDVNGPTRTKVGLALISIEELQQTRKKVAHRLVRNLREFYNVPLNASTIKYFVKNYGADKEYLTELNKNTPKAKVNMDERYNVHLKLTNWEGRFTALTRKMKIALSQK